MANDFTVRIVIADDHPIFRDGLKRLLDSEPGLRVVGEGGDGTEALQLARQLQPDVLLLDLSMPRVAGLEALKAITALPTPPRTVVLTAGLEKDGLLTALQLGARGIVLKEAATVMLFKCIRCVMAGEYWLGRDTVADVVEAMRRLGAQLQAQKKKDRFSLTPRELEVVAAVVSGESNTIIAQRLSVSRDTVKHHLSSVFDKLGVFSRVELAVFAINHGLVTEDQLSVLIGTTPA